MDTSYAVAPGEYLNEWMEEEGHGITQGQLAERLGVSRKLVNGVLCGRDPVSVDTAIRLERVTGIPRDSWSRLEMKYREDVARLSDERELAAHVDIVSPNVGAYLRSCGATRATKRNPGRLVSDFLAFIGCGTVDAFEMRCQRVLGCVPTHKEAGKTLDGALLLMWLSAGERSGAYLSAPSLEFDSSALRAVLPELRKRASVSDEKTIPDLTALLRDVGVVYQFIEAPKGLPLHGVTRWVDERVPVIQQTGRRHKDGFIIWTLFHELGHILNDDGHGMRLEFNRQQNESAQEKRANQFAKDMLFGSAGLSPFRGLTATADIRRRAQGIGVNPGVAVNMMHRMRMLDYSLGNDLLVDLDIPLEKPRLR